jgi:nickel-dependent lactate racemase
VHAGQSIAIVTSDITRPCPTDAMLPPLMEELTQAGVHDEDVTVVFGLGIHRIQTPEERARLVGPEMASRLRCIDSDPDQVVHVGTTSRGTPIEVFKQVVEADLRIALGSVEPHYFAGYSGGAKALVPGVCSKATIQHNHSMMVQPRARTGVLDGNPVREDIEEGVEQPADVVIVSAGGYPKDINLYQAHKALENAAVVVRPGGIIIWVAECSEGLGNVTFEEWIVGASGDDILTRIQQDFVLGGHKAAAIARVLKRAKVSLVSALPPELVRACGMTPYADLDKALSEALQEMKPDPVLAFMPEGAALIPLVGAK